MCIEDSKVEIPTKELKKKLNLVIDNLTADLYHISKEESRMNKKNSTDISKYIKVLDLFILTLFRPTEQGSGFKITKTSNNFES